MDHLERRRGRRAARFGRRLCRPHHPCRLLRVGDVDLERVADPGESRHPHRRRARLPHRFGRAIGRRRDVDRIRPRADHPVPRGVLHEPRDHGRGARRRRRRRDPAVVGRRRARDRARHARRRCRFGRFRGVGCRERRHPVRRRRRAVHERRRRHRERTHELLRRGCQVHAGRRRHRRGTRAARHERRAARCTLRRLGPVRRRDQRGRRPGRAGGHAPDRGARAARDRPTRTRAADR